MKIWCGVLITLVCLFLPGVLATTIIYNTPAVGPVLNASVTAGTGIVVTGNGTVIVISFDTVFGDLRYYPYALNPAGYLTNYTETDPVFSSENSSLWSAINARLIASDQRYNDTALVMAVNTSENIKSLGFDNRTDDYANDSASILFAPGSGLNAVVAKPLKGAGQLILVNGSDIVTGVGTQFLGGQLNTLDSYYAFYVGDQQYYVYPITSNTTANLTASLFGPPMNWTQGNLTTELVLVVNVANGSLSRALGFGTGAYGVSSTALGFETVASGDYSTALGTGTTANASGATAVGSSTVASGLNSFASGFMTTASGNTAFASGQNTVASGLYATAMGFQTTAGSYAMATGRETVAEAVGAFATGYRTNTTSYASLVIGRYNVGGGTFNSWVAADSVFEVGMGANSTALANAFTVYKNGNVRVAGTLTLGATPWAVVDRFNMTLVLTSSSSSSVYSLVPNLTLTLQNGSTYMVRCELVNDAAAATTGVQLRVNTTGSPSMVQTTWTSFSSNSAMEAFFGTSTSSNAFADSGSSTTAALGTINAVVITAASQSVWTVEMHSETANAANIEKGSYCLAVKV